MRKNAPPPIKAVEIVEACAVDNGVAVRGEVLDVPGQLSEASARTLCSIRKARALVDDDQIKAARKRFKDAQRAAEAEAAAAKAKAEEDAFIAEQVAAFEAKAREEYRASKAQG